MSGPDGSSTHQFDATTLAAHDARGVVRETLAGYSEAVVEVAALLASELVTNAVQHAGSQPSMRIEANGGGFRVAVHDGSHQLPRMAPPTENADSGWGLQLVEALSTEWGVTPTSDGKTIWFEFLEPAAYTADAGPFTSLGE